MKEQIRISGKNLGLLQLNTFCPRCFWIKLHCNNKLPFQIFPGIFFSIDSYSKKITDLHFEQHRRIPVWFKGFGSIGKPVKVPHFSQFSVFVQKTNILLTGAPDAIFQKNGSYFIVDYKTAKFTATQDELLPMYEVQLNAYAYIAERVGFNPVKGLGLLYYEPLTNISTEDIKELTHKKGFLMRFEGKLLPIDYKPNSIRQLLAKVREIYEQPIPKGIDGCKDCVALERIISLIS